MNSKDFTNAHRLLLSLIGKIDTALVNLLEILIKHLNDSSSSTTLGWRCSNSANISIPNNTDTILTFNSNSYDDGFHMTTVQSSRATIKSAGRYNIGANVEFADLTIGTRACYLLLNGVTTIAAAEWAALRMTINTDYAFIAGDYIEVYVKQNSGGALNVISTTYSPTFWGHKI